MIGYELAFLHRVIEDHQKMLSSKHNVILCAGLQLQAVKDQLEDLYAQILLHQALAFPEEAPENDYDDGFNRCFYTPPTTEQHLHYRISENLETHIPQLKKLLTTYETLVAKLN
jgi:hypothetical protein